MPNQALAVIGRHSYADLENAPPERLPALRHELAVSLSPASEQQVEAAVTDLVGSFKVGDVLEEPRMFARAMVRELASYPLGVLLEAVSEARRTEEWLPSIATMVRICDERMGYARNKLALVENRVEQLRKEAEFQGRIEAAVQELQVRGADTAEIARVARITSLEFRSEDIWRTVNSLAYAWWSRSPVDASGNGGVVDFPVLCETILLVVRWAADPDALDRIETLNAPNLAAIREVMPDRHSEIIAAIRRERIELTAMRYAPSDETIRWASEHAPAADPMDLLPGWKRKRSYRGAADQQLHPEIDDNDASFRKWLEEVNRRQLLLRKAQPSP